MGDHETDKRNLRSGLFGCHDAGADEDGERRMSAGAGVGRVLLVQVDNRRAGSIPASGTLHQVKRDADHRILVTRITELA